MTDYSDILYEDRPASARPKMDLGNRAKIFAPFDALRGFNFAIMAEEAERAMLPRVELSEDLQEELNSKLERLCIGSTVTVCYFAPQRRIGDLELGYYHTVTEQVDGIDPYSHTLFLSCTAIPVADIRDLQLEEGDAHAD